MFYAKKTLIPLILLLNLIFFCFCLTRQSKCEDWSRFLSVFLFTFSIIFIFLRAKFTLFSLKEGLIRKQDHRIFEALSEGIVLLSNKGVILYFNRKAEKSLKLSQSKLLGEELSNFTHLPLIKTCHKLFKQCQATNVEQSLSFCLEKESKKSLDLDVKPIQNPTQYLIFIRDSSPQYQKHRLGKDFVANASHELRTPITIIKGFAEALHELPQISSNTLIRDSTEKIIRNCQRMDHLVTNLLTLTELDYLPKAHLQECDLVTLVDNCIYNLLRVYPDTNIRALRNKEVISIPADPHLIEHALMNLLENGAKYSLAPVDLTITIQDRSDSACLSVADKGKGIPIDDLDHIFERFYTVNKAHSRKFGGAGLGLSIVQTIVKKHGGKIEVFSKEGRGTKFVLTFQKPHDASNYSLS